MHGDGKTWAEICRDGIPNPDIVKTITYFPANPCTRNSPDLPFEIITEILARLPIEALIRNKTVCKRWNELTSDPHFIDMQAKIASSSQPRRILFIPEYASCDETRLLLVNNQKGKWKCIELANEFPLGSLKNLRDPHWYEYRIVGSCNGLLCMVLITSYDELSAHEFPICIYNPITRESQELPYQHVKPAKSRAVYGFGFDKLSNKYKVVCMYITAAQLATRGAILTLGEHLWRKLEHPYKLLFAHQSDMVFLDGAFHSMIDYDSRAAGPEIILSLDIHTEEFSTISFPPLIQSPDKLHASTRLSNFAESLTIVESDTYLGARDAVRIWQIVGSRDTGRRICQYTCRLSPAYCHKYCFEIEGMLSDGNFLFRATKKYGDYSDDVIVYDNSKKRCFIVPLLSAPLDFGIRFFMPSLVSPIAICGTEHKK